MNPPQNSHIPTPNDSANTKALSEPQTGFTQDDSYAGYFYEYKSLLDGLLNHDLTRFELEKDSFIADIGCGFGENLSALRQQGYKRLIGVEPDPLCRSQAAKRGFDVIEGTLESTSLEAHSIDAAIVSQVFHHVADYEGALKELVRVIRPGGDLCFAEPAPTSLRKLMDYLTFETPLRRFCDPVELRHRVMKLEIETGLYQRFLENQKGFRSLLEQHFNCVWHDQSWFFQFGKYQRKYDPITPF